MSKEYTIFQGDQPFKVLVDMRFLQRIDKNISNILIRSETYIIRSKVQPQNLQSFLNYLVSEDSHLEINSNNYLDYYILNEEFKSDISRILLKPEYDVLLKESILNDLISHNFGDNYISEKYAARNLDFYLNNYDEKMSKIPLNSLYNIFNHEDRILNDHIKAYQFICKNIAQHENDEKKESFCILLGSLEATKMNEKSIIDSVSKKDEHFGYAPKLNDSLICSLNKKMTEINRQVETKFEQIISLIMNQQQQTIDKINNLIESKFSSIDKNYSLLSNKIDKSIQSINEIRNDISKLSQKCDKKNTEIQQICEKVNTCNQKEEEIKNSLQQLKAKIGFISLKHCIEFKYENLPFNGIIHKLTEENGGNVHNKGIVNVTSSSISNSRFDYYAVDLNDENFYFCSDNKEDSWLQYDFKNFRVHPTHYSLRSSNHYSKGQYNLISWIIEGSNTGENWIELDSQSNVYDLDGINMVKTFEIKNPTKSNEFFRFLRIRETGKDSYGDNYMLFSALEYFGSLIYSI